MLLSAKDVRATLKTHTSMDVWTKGLVGNVAESLESLEHSLARQSEKLAEALKEKNSWIERYDKLREQSEREKLQLIAALRPPPPPEPKFKVGQILNVTSGSYVLFPKHILVTRIEFHAHEKEFRYWWHRTANNDEMFFRESQLRALTAQEKGESA